MSFIFSGKFSFVMNPLTAIRSSPSIVVALTLAILVLFSFVVIFSITPSPSLLP